jgi:hypothetical protein
MLLVAILVRGEKDMTDLMNGFFVIASFGLAIGFVYACERLK